MFIASKAIPIKGYSFIIGVKYSQPEFSQFVDQLVPLLFLSLSISIGKTISRCIGANILLLWLYYLLIHCS